MNYRHIYHAGNAADVFKHAVLALLLRRLAAKDTPFAVLDTHAGVGVYDLARTEAQRTGEFRDGIARLLAVYPASMPDEPVRGKGCRDADDESQQGEGDQQPARVAVDASEKVARRNDRGEDPALEIERRQGNEIAADHHLHRLGDPTGPGRDPGSGPDLSLHG